MFTSEYSILECPPIRPLIMDTTTPPKWKFNNTIEIAPNCPRCASSNTKFCYYNNYSLSQPRYFCKGCRRYWTKGGSLRNVPVGGGCRKSRRSRAVTRSQNDPLNYSTSALSPTVSNESEPGTNIDMADVFAKYVNQNLVHNDESSSSPGGSSVSSDNVQASSDSTMFEYQIPVDLINGPDCPDHDQIPQVVPQFSMHDDFNGQDFVYQDSSAFEVQQGIFGNGLSADLLWSSDGTDFPDFGSQQSTVQILQDSGLIFSSDDQLRISANLETGNWDTFDLSAYELFSKP